MNQNEIDQRAEDLTSRVESGNTDGLSEELNSMTIEDRLSVARKMDEINEQHRASNSDLPDIEIVTTDGIGGSEHLSEVNLREERGWYNPAKWFGDSRSSEDIYDPPAGELGSGMAQQAGDLIRDRSRRIDEMTRGY